MSSITEKLQTLKSELPDNVHLVAVSKFHPVEALREAYDAGQRIFGESRQQEIELKHTQLPKDIEWHFIGHLQTNKVKSIVPYVHTIESVNSVKLLEEINKQAGDAGVKIHCLLEIHIAKEPQKYGFTKQECIDFFMSGEWKRMANVIISGVMGMATFTNDTVLIGSEFHSLKVFFEQLKETFFKNSADFKHISMGMSNDYKIAVEAGSTMVRIGTFIFGDRIY